MQYARILVATMVLTTALFGAFATPAAASSSDHCDDYSGILGMIEDHICDNQDATSMQDATEYGGGAGCAGGNCLEYKNA